MYSIFAGRHGAAHWPTHLNLGKTISPATFVPFRRAAVGAFQPHGAHHRGPLHITMRSLAASLARTSATSECSSPVREPVRRRDTGEAETIGQWRMTNRILSSCGLVDLWSVSTFARQLISGLSLIARSLHHRQLIYASITGSHSAVVFLLYAIHQSTQKQE